MREDCGVCEFCREKKKFGGNGGKRSCVHRRCVKLHGAKNDYIPMTSEFSSEFTQPALYLRTGIRENIPDDEVEHLGEAKAPIYNVPTFQPKENVCGGCGLDQHPTDDEMIICDGCDAEYHLSCAIPPLKKVPEGDWYCPVCNGTTETLIQSLEAADELKATFSAPEQFLQHLWKEDLRKVGESRRAMSEIGRVAEMVQATLESNLTRTRSGKNIPNLSSDFLIGKPIFIYEPVSDLYHRGRILDCREREGCVEYFVRFAAGCNLRSKSYSHWIVLEEYLVQIGVALVWMEVSKGNWEPGQVMVRSAREIIPVQFLLREASGEVIYEDESDIKLVKNKNKKILVAMVRSFRSRDGKLCRLKDQTVDFFAQDAQERFNANNKLHIPVCYALAEHSEQERARRWWSLRLENQFHPKCLSLKDELALEPLHLSSCPTFPATYVVPCPSVPQGVDRLHLMDHLQQRNICPSKDLAESLLCRSIGGGVGHYWAEILQEKSTRSQKPSPKRHRKAKFQS